MALRDFVNRHIGPGKSEEQEMLASIRENSVAELINKTVPAGIRLQKALDVPPAMSESDYLAHIRQLEAMNQVFDTYIGLGYYNTYTPSVILRNVFENPGWYTAYTPYQAEVAQGRLEALLNYQTMVSDLTGLPIANASLLDEGTAAGEAMLMFFNNRSKEQVASGSVKFFVSDKVFPQTRDVLITRAEPLGIELVFGHESDFVATNSYFGALIQYPDMDGEIVDWTATVASWKAMGIKVCVATDLLALVLLTPPGSWGADVAVGNSQRFGVPMGYGGPHAAFFATTEEFKRFIPGRIIGLSKDAQGKPALRMALQTREQHIRRDKATSNICTAQALLAVMAGMYACYHGAEGLREIAGQVASHTAGVRKALEQLGYSVKNAHAFDTLTITGADVAKLQAIAVQNRINLRYNSNGSVSISLDETSDAARCAKLILVFAQAMGKEAGFDAASPQIATNLKRTDDFLTHPVFNSYHSESKMMRYLKKLENKDVSLTHSMISLGSCTMKLNAASQLMPLSLPGFANIHPFVPVDQAQGYHAVFDFLDKTLSNITGFARMSLQPNSGAQGEYAGLMVMRAWHLANGNANRTVILIPSSAHGTNPASAVMAGMKVVVVSCDDKGNVDMIDLRAKAEQYSADLAGLMVTYPSTHGVFEETITEITGIIHQHGGQVYMDGANMNAQVGLTSPGRIGADVCHLNLHKTFAIPHGGGGPGMGPIGVAAHLAPFLPGNPLVNCGGDKAIHAISAAPYGSALILLISYGYIRMLGADGLTRSTETAILNANYMKERLKVHYPILYTGTNGTVAHEMILDCREFKRTAGIEVEDIAKRLMDYGFHAPTVSFPVAGTLMVEPTESESKDELDRFCDALIAIRDEIRAVEQGVSDKADNPLKHAPHTAQVVIADAWSRSYSREQAAFPLEFTREAKFWPSVSRVDNAYGDRNLVCTCPPLEMYMEATV
jgi:glycine dehydrogenase